MAPMQIASAHLSPPRASAKGEVIVGIVLAAGDGTRMGGSKALLLFGSEPLCRVHARNLLDAGASRVIVVVRPHVVEGIEATTGMELVPSAAIDQAGSLSLAVRALPDGDAAFLITPVDCVPASSQTLARLLDLLAHGESLAVTPRFQGKGGHPVACRSEVLSPYRVGPRPPPLRDVLAGLGARRDWVDVDDPAIGTDLDAPADVLRATGENPRFAR